MAAPWADVARIKVFGKVQGQDYNNVMHLATNTIINDAQQLNQLLSELCLAMLECFTDTLAAFTSDFRIDGVEGVSLHPTLSDPIVVAAPANSVGTATATSVSFAATLVQIRTGLGGRKGRGKIFLPPGGEGEITNSSLTAASEAQFALWVACVVGKFIGAGASTPWRLGVLSRKDLAANNNNYDLAFREAQSLLLKTDVAKMGSRKKGSGN